MKSLAYLFSGILLLSIQSCNAQYDQSLKNKYTVVNRDISAGKDAGSVYLNNEDGVVGIAWVNNEKFTNGTIEVDIRGKDELQASFVGIAFHGVDGLTYETVYFRPFNFRSPDPMRKIHAVQYMALPNYDWETLRNTFPGKYEKSVSPVPDPNDWFHARITVDTKNIKVYVNGNTVPSLVVEPLVHTGGTKIGLWTSTDGYWKNLKVIPGK